ncbi:MAG: hypothetical protein ABGF52_13520 [Candidatus Asgardarchaeum sp.]
MLSWTQLIVLIVSVIGICGAIMTCDIIIIMHIKSLNKTLNFLLEEIEMYRRDRRNGKDS